MIRKTSFVLSGIAALGLAAAFTTAQAKPVQYDGGGTILTHVTSGYDGGGTILTHVTSGYDGGGTILTH
ncbi:MAG: hypothetical protein ACRET2_00310 [Steroidobacteraceae bacterium]